MIGPVCASSVGLRIAVVKDYSGPGGPRIDVVYTPTHREERWVCFFSETYNLSDHAKRPEHLRRCVLAPEEVLEEAMRFICLATRQPIDNYAEPKSRRAHASSYYHLPVLPTGAGIRPPLPRYFTDAIHQTVPLRHPPRQVTNAIHLDKP